MGDDPAIQRLAGGLRLGGIILTVVPFLIVGLAALWLWLGRRKDPFKSGDPGVDAAIVHPGSHHRRD